MSDENKKVLRLSVEDLRRFARYQRWLIIALMAQFGLWVLVVVGRLSLRGVDIEPTGPIFLTYILASVGALQVFLIYGILRESLTGFILTATAFPLLWTVLLPEMPPALPLIISGITLVIVNGRATKVLNACDVTVGFFGADADSIKEQNVYDDDEDLGW